MAAEDRNPDRTQTSRARSWFAPGLVVALLMAVEGVGVFILAKAVGARPSDALAVGEGYDGITAGLGADAMAEIEIAECRPSNKMSGKFITFQIRVSALVSYADQERANQLVRARQARLEDGVNTVIRGAGLKQLNEPGLETIKRRLKHEVERILDDDRLIKEVLIPELLQSRGGV